MPGAAEVGIPAEAVGFGMVGEADTLPAAAGVGIPVAVEEVAAIRRAAGVGFPAEAVGSGMVAEIDNLPEAAGVGIPAEGATPARVGKAVQSCKAVEVGRAGEVASLAAVGAVAQGYRHAKADTLPAAAAVGIPAAVAEAVWNCWVAGTGFPVGAAVIAEVYLEESSLILAF